MREKHPSRENIFLIPLETLLKSSHRRTMTHDLVMIAKSMWFNEP